MRRADKVYHTEKGRRCGGLSFVGPPTPRNQNNERPAIAQSRRGVSPRDFSTLDYRVALTHSS